MASSRARLAPATAMALALVVAIASWQRSARLHPVIYQYEAGGLSTTDVWFDGDLPKIACMMTHADAGQHRVTSEHPLLPSATFGPAALLRLAHAAPPVVFRAWSAAVAGLWTMVFFALLYRITGRLADAIVFTMLGAATSAATFWMSVPEAFVLGSITLLLPFFLAAAPRPAGPARHTLLAMLAMSVTVTNAISAASASFATLPWRHAWQVLANAVLLLTVTWAMQAAWFPHSTYFLGSGRVLELIRDDEKPAPAAVLRTALVSSIVMPAVAITHEPDRQGLTVQHAWPHYDEWWGAGAAVAWVALFLAGVAELMRQESLRALRLVTGITVAGQLAIHFIIGRETFLYTMHIAPVLIVAAACAGLGRRRRLGLTLAATIAMAAAVNNSRQFDLAARVTHDLGARAAAGGAVFEAATQCE